MMKKLLAILALIAVGFIIALYVPRLFVVQSGRGHFVGGGADEAGNVDELTFIATDIVRGVILDERVEQLITLLPPPSGPDEMYLSMRADFYQIHTIHRIMVSEVFMGDAQVGNVMEIAQPGGRLGSAISTNSEMLHFAAGDDLVLFVRTFYNSHGVNRPAIPITPFQSAYRVVSSNRVELADGIVAAYDEDPGLANMVLENFSSDNNMVLTVGELMWIRFESGLGSRPQHERRQEIVDMTRLNESINRAEYY